MGGWIIFGILVVVALWLIGALVVASAVTEQADIGG